MTIFNNLNSLIFYSLVIVTVGLIGFSIYYSDNTVNGTVINGNVDSSSNNVNSGVSTPTENPDTTNPAVHIDTLQEVIYRELLEILSPQMEEKGVSELNLRHMVYSYSLRDLTRRNIKLIIIARFCNTYLNIL
jgi:hypothetical protein